jgi:OOP family OmpA-OmpF porin
VLGFTDILGTDDYDLELSQGRAEAVAAILKKAAPTDQFTLRVKGEGKTGMHANTTPEGRFFNRTVQIVIQIDKKK